MLPLFSSLIGCLSESLRPSSPFLLPIPSSTSLFLFSSSSFVSPASDHSPLPLPFHSSFLTCLPFVIYSNKLKKKLLSFFWSDIIFLAAIQTQGWDIGPLARHFGPIFMKVYKSEWATEGRYIYAQSHGLLFLCWSLIAVAGGWGLK